MLNELQVAERIADGTLPARSNSAPAVLGDPHQWRWLRLA